MLPREARFFFYSLSNNSNKLGFQRWNFKNYIHQYWSTTNLNITYGGFNPEAEIYFDYMAMKTTYALMQRVYCFIYPFLLYYKSANMTKHDVSGFT